MDKWEVYPSFTFVSLRGECPPIGWLELLLIRLNRAIRMLEFAAEGVSSW